ncbi:S-layer homology domain-containing protein [Paenibacillus cremeus]|nr:S-layer homology domain-containing protein [Paenibacillus cremeus]
MKKKVFATTVAASLVLGSFAGLPLSSNGLLEKAGISVAYASADTIPGQVQVIENYLWDDAEKQSVINARTKLSGLYQDASETDGSGHYPRISEVWQVIQAKLDNTPDKTNFASLTESNLVKLLSDLGLFLTTNPQKLTDSLNDPTNRETLRELVALGGGDTTQFEVQTAVDFSKALESQLKTQLKDIDLTGMLSFTTDNEQLKTMVKNAIKNTIDNDNKLGLVFRNLNISKDALTAVAQKLLDYADPKHEAVKSIGLAMLRSETVLVETTGSTTNTKNYQLKTFDKVMPAGFFSWTSSNPNVSVAYNSNSGYVVASLISGNTAVTTFEGAINVPTITTSMNGKKLYKSPQAVTLYIPSNGGSSDPTPPSGGGGGGGGGAVTSSPLDTAQKDLSDIKGQIEKASNVDKAKLIEQAAAKVADALAKASVIDVKSNVVVANGKAELKLDTTAMINQIKDLAAKAQSLIDGLKAVAGKDVPVVKPVLKLNLGDISVKAVDIPLSASILKAAADSGLSQIALNVGGVGIAISPSAFNGDTKLSVSKQESTVATSATQLPIASEVYEFNMTVNGQQVSSFSTPVQLSLPVSNPAQFDKELLTLAKIENGGLIFYGGEYNAATGQVEGNRTGFSSYTVVENKVEFDDTASVKAWAGRQIQVAAAKGILEGREAKLFVPNESVTRAEFAKMLVNTFGILDAQAVENFGDVSDADWFKPYVATAVKYGLVNGRSEGVFDPNGKITRAEMATMAARALSAFKDAKPVADVNGSLKDFKDVAAINDTLKSGVALSAAQGIVVGEEGGQFNPDSNSTRAQAAVVIYRLLNK